MQYRSLGWAPIPARGKSPVPQGATGRQGTVTDGKIGMWSQDSAWQNENVALRAEGYIAIDVDDYGDKVGAQTMRDLEAQLGELPVTITSTARGDDDVSRQHFYRVPDGVAFVGELGDVEIIQRTHRYSVVFPSIHPDTGAQYRWYGYEGEPLGDMPAIDDLEDLPEAWLAYLSKPDGDDIDFSPFMGTVADWVAKCATGDAGDFLLRWVDEIPKTDFGHDDMVQMQASLIGFGAAGKPGVPWALQRLREAWLRPPYGTPEYEMDWNLGLKGAIEKWGAFEADILGQFATPPPAPSAPIDYVEAAGRVNNPAFFTAWTSIPENPTPETLGERVRYVLALCLEDGGVSRLEAVEIAWNAAARKHAACAIDSREGVEALATDTFPDERAPEMEASPAEPEPEPSKARRVRLLKPAEDALLDQIDWWGDDKREEHFMSRMHEINPVMSEPYYRLNRWILLSLIFASKAVIPSENGTMVPLNFYGINLGPSGSGKSESLNCVADMMAAYYLPEDDPDIGGDSTTAGLTQALIRRDGRSSLFHADEADAVFRSWSESQGAFSGMKQRITDLFGGKVPMLNRTGAKEISGIRAVTYLCVHLIGVDERITDAIEPHDWESGFVNRFIVANGHRKPRTREQKRFRVRRPGSGGGGGIESWYAQWAAQFRRTVETKLATEDGKPAWVDFDDEVLDRHIDTTERFEAMAHASSYPERLRPTFTRMEMTILKCSALVAITKGRLKVEIEDYLVALEQAEEWVENIMDLVEATDESPRARQADRLAQLIRSNGGVMGRSAIHAHKGYAGDKRFTNGLIEELEAQNRVEILPTTKTDAMIRLEEAA